MKIKGLKSTNGWKLFRKNTPKILTTDHLLPKYIGTTKIIM